MTNAQIAELARRETLSPEEIKLLQLFVLKSLGLSKQVASLLKP